MRQVSKAHASIARASLAQLCLFASAKYKEKTAFSMFSEGVISKKVTYAQMGNRAQKIASLLKQIDIKNGDKVILISENCPQWAIAYFGIALAGAVSVPLLTGFSNEQVEHLINHCSARAICISCEMAEKFKDLLSLPALSNIPVINIENIIENENPATESNEKLNYCNQDPEELASIIYTSGTQGSSKGVMLSSKNLISSALSSSTYVKIKPGDRLLSVLPLAHSYECGLGLIAAVINGASITYLDRPPSSSVLLPAVQLIRPTIMIAVPLLIEKVYNNAIAPKLHNNKLYKFPLTRPLAILVAGYKLKSALGGKLRFFGIGGAPLSPQVEDFLYKAKFPYCIGYGLTETAPLAAGNAPFKFKIGSGISAPKGVTIRVEDGEIQVQGPNVMLGYYNDKERTSEVFTHDGWLRTGDLGWIDKKGSLFIKGRLKALILGPSGENIYPEEIEKLLGASSFVEESLVYSGKRGELVALVILSEAAKAAAGAIEHTLEELRTFVNKKLADFSRLSKIEIKNEPFEKTPTMKIKRYLYA